MFGYYYAALLTPAEKRSEMLELNGAAYVTRTRDPVITNDVLYQLS